MIKKEKLFKTIMDENQERIFRICCYYSKNPEDRKDLFQEILINIWSSLESFRGDSAIGTWVYRVAVNTALGFVKQELKQKQFVEKIDLIQSNQFFKDESDDHHEHFEQKLRILHAQISQLSIIDKVIITLFLEDLPSKGIANIVGITEPNVRVKIHRIKNQLKNDLKGITL